jgi:hypothetical protein
MLPVLRQRFPGDRRAFPGEGCPGSLENLH